MTPSATSYANRFYSTTFVPEVASDYRVIATFAGSKSYWGSHAETAISVEDAPTATAVPVVEKSSRTIFAPAVIAIILAIFVVNILIVLLVRKRP